MVHALRETETGEKPPLVPSIAPFNEAQLMQPIARATTNSMETSSSVDSLCDETKGNGFYAVLWAALVAGTLDLSYVVILFGLRGVPPLRILQSIATGWYGRAAYQGGLGVALVGFVSHFVIALGAAGLYYALSRKLKVMIERPVLSGLVYGGLFYLLMNLVVLPFTAVPKTSFPPPGWEPILIAHFLCVGLPIAWVVRRFSR